MNPDFLTFDSNVVQPLWAAGELAMVNMWGSAVHRYVNPEHVPAEIGAATRFAAAPTVGGNARPATTVWWDGFTIAANITDEDAEATFRAMLNGISPAMMQANPATAVWLIEGFEPGRTAEGVIATVRAGAAPYPMTAYMSLLHTALGNNLVEFMRGEETAEQALADTAQAYRTAAREAGFLQ